MWLLIRPVWELPDIDRESPETGALCFVNTNLSMGCSPSEVWAKPSIKLRIGGDNVELKRGCVGGT